MKNEDQIKNAVDFKILSDDRNKMISDIKELQRMIYRLTDYVYHIQQYLISLGDKDED